MMLRIIFLVCLKKTAFMFAVSDKCKNSAKHFDTENVT